MSRQERLAVVDAKIEKHQNKINKCYIERGAIMDESGRWRQEKGMHYHYTSDTGLPRSLEEAGHDTDNRLFKSGNYYQTEEQAKLGPEYFHANSEFTFWHPGMESRPKKIPEGCEEFRNDGWYGSIMSIDEWDYVTHRWPKTSPVEWVK